MLTVYPYGDVYIHHDNTLCHIAGTVVDLLEKIDGEYTLLM